MPGIFPPLLPSIASIFASYFARKRGCSVGEYDTHIQTIELFVGRSDIIARSFHETKQRNRLKTHIRMTIGHEA